MELKKLELLCQHNLHIKSRPLLFTPRFNNIKCTKFLFFMYCNVKEKGQITRNKNSKKKCLYRKSVLLLFWFTKIRFGMARTTKT